MPTITLINQSTQLTNAQIQAAIPALQTQVNNHLAPVWRTNATISFSAGTPPATDWQVIIMDTYSQANILGYHEQTLAGLPIGYVFINNAALKGVSWTVIASHEILEMLVDPDINLSVLTDSSPYQQPGENWLFAYEICDPVQLQTYNINGVAVSNFVYPTWFESFWQPFGAQFDYLNQCIVPFQLQQGGFIFTNNIVSTSGGWQELYAFGTQKRPTRGTPGSRRERRTMGRRNWRRSFI